MIRAAAVAGAVGGCFAVAEGLLLLVLGGLAGLAENPKSEAAMTDGYVVLGLGAFVLAVIVVARQRPLVLAVTTGATAAVGFLVENALWVFAAIFLFAAAALAIVSTRGSHRAA